MTGLYYPESVTVGKPISTVEIANALADRSTVTRADTLAVLTDLGSVMSTYMAQGKSVKLNGLGSFRYTIGAHGQGAETAEEVTCQNIKNVKVTFIPETTRNSDNSVATRSMLTTTIDWIKWEEPEEEKKKEETEDDSGSSDSGNSGNDDGNNPL